MTRETRNRTAQQTDELEAIPVGEIRVDYKCKECSHENHVNEAPQPRRGGLQDKIIGERRSDYAAPGPELTERDPASSTTPASLRESRGQRASAANSPLDVAVAPTNVRLEGKSARRGSACVIFACDRFC